MSIQKLPTRNEPDCAIRNALDSKEIHPARYQSYINLISEWLRF